MKRLPCQLVLLTALAGSFCGGGCLTSTVGRIRTDDTLEEARPRTSPDAIALFATKDCGRPFAIVGAVIAASSTGEQPARTEQLLREQAALAGADAVVDVRARITYGYWTRAVELGGTAVRWK